MRAIENIFALQPCESCRYAVPQNAALKNGPLQCRRQPPTVVLMPVQGMGGNVGLQPMTIWPGMGKNDSCGEGLPRMTISQGDSMPVPQIAGDAA